MTGDEFDASWDAAFGFPPGPRQKRPGPLFWLSAGAVLGGFAILFGLHLLGALK